MKMLVLSRVNVPFRMAVAGVATGPVYVIPHFSVSPWEMLKVPAAKETVSPADAP